MFCLSGAGRSTPISLLPNNEVHIHSWVESELGDLLDGGGGAVDVDDSLVNVHFESIKGIGTVSARRAAHSDCELLGWNTNGSLNLVVEVLGLEYDLRACFLEGLHSSSSKSHSDSVDLLSDFLTLDLVFLSVHFQISKANFLINNKAIQAHPLNQTLHFKYSSQLFRNAPI